MMVRRPPQGSSKPNAKPADLARELRAEIHRSATRRRAPISLPTLRALRDPDLDDAAPGVEATLSHRHTQGRD